MRIIGFRTRKTWKMILASVTYGIVGLGVIGAIVSPDSEESSGIIETHIIEVESDNIESEAETEETTTENTKTEETEIEKVEKVTTVADEETPKELYNIIQTLDQAFVKEEIKNKAVKDWDKDYTMQEYAIKNQTQAYNNLLKVNVDEEVKQILLENAFKDWKYDFTMVEYAYNNQIGSFDEVVKIVEEFGEGTPEYEILIDAIDSWGYDFTMVLYAYEQQLKSYNSLNR